jgi:hypothetical protein
VPSTIATDGPEMMRTHLRDEFELLLKIGAVDEEQFGEAVQIDFMGLQIDSLELRIRTTRIPPSNSAVEPGASSAASTFVPSASATLTGSARS